MPVWQQIAVRAGWIVFILGLVWLYLRYFEWKNLYYPTRVIESTPADAKLKYTNVTFVAEDDCRLHGWWIPHDQARGTVIILHGNAGNIGGRIWVASDLHRLGLNVFLFDYRGYGESRGIPTEKGTYRDARAAFEVVRARYEDVEEPPIIAYGRSLGGAVAVQLALDKPLKGIMLESTFSSVLDMGRELYPFLPVKLFSRFHYDSISKIDRVAAPKLIAHSRDDEMIPFKMGERLYERAADPKRFIELRGGHNESGWERSEAYWQAVEGFVDQALGPQKTP